MGWSPLLRAQRVSRQAAAVPTMPYEAKWKRLDWDDLDFYMEGSRLVLRHNKKLQFGHTIRYPETLKVAMEKMMTYCMEHPDGNKKICGFIKVVEHMRINDCPMRVMLTKWINQDLF